MTIRENYEEGVRRHRMTTKANVFTWDIETKPMTGYFFHPKVEYVTPDKIIDHGGMLTWAGKFYGERTILDAAEWRDGKEEMVRALWDALDRADIVVTFNGDKFDIRYTNAEFIAMGLPKPSPYKSVDLLKIVRTLAMLPYNRMDEVARWLGLPRKMHHEGFALWRAVVEGDERARAKMLRYNRQDIRVTESIYDALRPWIPNHPNLGLWAGSDDDGNPVEVCCNCGSANLTRGEADTRTALTGYATVRCGKCGAIMRRNHVRERVNLRPVRGTN